MIINAFFNSTALGTSIKREAAPGSGERNKNVSAKRYKSAGSNSRDILSDELIDELVKVSLTFQQYDEGVMLRGRGSEHLTAHCQQWWEFVIDSSAVTVEDITEWDDDKISETYTICAMELFRRKHEADAAGIDNAAASNGKER
jgi:hypothetical protein